MRRFVLVGAASVATGSQRLPVVDEMVGAAEPGRFAWIDHGRHIVDFVHVDNLAGAAVLALTQGHPDGVYYVTDGTPLRIRDFLTPLLATRGVDLTRSRSIPLAVAAPMAAAPDGTARALRWKTAPPLTNWLVSFTGRDRSYGITAAKTELGYRPAVSFEDGLAGMRRSAGVGHANSRPRALSEDPHGS